MLHSFSAFAALPYYNLLQRKEDKGSFLPRNLRVVVQMVALPAGAPDEREQGSEGVQQV